MTERMPDSTMPSDDEVERARAHADAPASWRLQVTASYADGLQSYELVATQEMGF